MVKVLPHKHCVVCGKAVEPDKSYCSDKCEDQLKKDQKRQRMFFLMLFGILIIMILFSLLSAPKG